MKLQLVAVGTKMPAWIQTGFITYQRRFPSTMPLELIEIPAVKRGKRVDIKRILDQEGEHMLAAVGKRCSLVSLDVRGQSWDTPTLANQLENWRNQGQDVAFLIGGPEGLSHQCQQTARQHWSLSALTLPHPLVRVWLQRFISGLEFERPFTLSSGINHDASVKGRVKRHQC